MGVVTYGRAAAAATASRCRHECAISGGYLPLSKEANKPPPQPNPPHPPPVTSEICRPLLICCRLTLKPRLACGSQLTLRCLWLIIWSTAARLNGNDLKDSLTLRSDPHLTPTHPPIPPFVVGSYPPPPPLNVKSFPADQLESQRRGNQHFHLK